MKITIYELLGLIKDGKAPKKINEIRNGIKYGYKFNEEDQWYETLDETTLMNIYDKDRLNDEVEIIEEDKKIKKLEISEMLKTKKWKRDKKTYQIINELIDEVNKLKVSK